MQIGLTLADQTDPPVPMSIVIAKELQIIGSHGMQAFEYQHMLRMIEDGKIQPQKLVGELVALSEACQRLPELNSFSRVGAVVIDRFE